MQLIWSDMWMNCAHVCFGWVVFHIFSAWHVVYLKISVIFLISLPYFQKKPEIHMYVIFIARDHCRLIVLLTIPEGCGLPNFNRSNLITLAS